MNGLNIAQRTFGIQSLLRTKNFYRNADLNNLNFAMLVTLTPRQP